MIDAERYCLERSLLLRFRPDETAWLVRQAIAQLPADRSRSPEQVRYQMEDRLEDAVLHRYGNPVVAWVLLNLIVPIVVRLVIAWWLESKEL